MSLVRLAVLLVIASFTLLSSCSGSGGSSSEPQEPANADDVLLDDAVAPPAGLVTDVTLSIEVPAYQSNALRVDIDWGELSFAATWVGDEFWSATETFSANTENTLTVTFSDRNGSVILGTVQLVAATGNNPAERVVITADLFDTERWDADGDGVSNLDELIAGTYDSEAPRVLLFSETRGYRHESIPVALEALEQLASSAGMQTDRADDSSGTFTNDVLARYDAVIWVLTSGDVLDDDEQAAFERYIRSGGGFAGVHAASDTEYDWPWYGDLVGAWFASHPDIQVATQIVEQGDHASTRHLGATWTRTDEWYDYRSNPRSRVNVLLRLDESSYEGGRMGADHPSAWYHAFDGGRSWYTGGGHVEASYAEPAFRQHLLGGLRYAVGSDG